MKAFLAVLQCAVNLGTWSLESNHTGLETEVIVKGKCKELIQCQKT
jgi:hypothetical protein